MLLAVHLSDGVLEWPWVAGGWAVAAGLVAVAGWRVRDDEIPRIGVMTAVLFVASQAQFKLGPTSVHLLLNGLAGVVLGRRVGLAVAVGLFLQALLAGHGGLTTLGVTATVYGVPALLAGAAFGPLRRAGVLRQPAVRFAAVALAAGLWLATAVVTGQWGWEKAAGGGQPFPDGWWVADPAVAAGVAGLALVAGWLERRLERDPDFPLGLLLGAATGYATVGLNVLVLTYGGVPGVPGVAGLVLLAHLPVIAVEAVAVGFVVAFLAWAKPEWLPGPYRPAGSGNTSPNGTSH